MVAPKGSIYSSTALASRQREVKDVADRQVVYITENGNGAYVFCSEEIFDRELKQAREDARYEAEMEFPGGPFDIVTFYEDEADRVTVLGLVHQRAAW